MTSADRMIFFRMAAAEIAREVGCICTFMPKPLSNRTGSGMHIHLSIAEQARPERNLFADKSDRRGLGLSPLAYHFLGGLLEHAPALAALVAPTVNSYKRLVVGESLSGTGWAPAYVAHGPNNRTALVRTLKGRFEWRLPDASANPYLATAALIAAGLDGLDRQLDPGPACTEDLFALSLPEIAARGVRVLPQSLGEAVDALERDEVVCAALGETLSHEFITLKRAEWMAYARHVSAWEIERYVTQF
jgi:glutamine synthetase